MNPLICKFSIPSERQPGGFGYKRSFYHHPGVDLYCLVGTPVFAIEDGEVVLIDVFTGNDATPPSPWWTQSILIEGKSGVI